MQSLSLISYTEYCVYWIWIQFAILARIVQVRSSDFTREQGTWHGPDRILFPIEGR